MSSSSSSSSSSNIKVTVKRLCSTSINFHLDFDNVKSIRFHSFAYLYFFQSNHTEESLATIVKSKSHNNSHLHSKFILHALNSCCISNLYFEIEWIFDLLKRQHNSKFIDT